MHCLLIVIGNGDLEETMAPYSQELKVPEYCNGEVTKYEKEQMLSYYNAKRLKQGKRPYRSFGSLYKAHGQDWNGGCWRKDADGVWREYSTDNPNMKWDWYEVGGRFAGQLVLKEGVKRIAPPSFSWGWDTESRQKVTNATPQRADIARLEDIANLDELTAISLLMNGIWAELDEKDFFGAPVKPYLEGLPGDTLVTIVDYHM